MDNEDVDVGVEKISLMLEYDLLESKRRRIRRQLRILLPGSSYDTDDTDDTVDCDDVVDSDEGHYGTVDSDDPDSEPHTDDTSSLLAAPITPITPVTPVTPITSTTPTTPTTLVTPITPITSACDRALTLQEFEDGLFIDMANGLRDDLVLNTAEGATVKGAPHLGPRLKFISTYVFPPPPLRELTKEEEEFYARVDALRNPPYKSPSPPPSPPRELTKEEEEWLARVQALRDRFDSKSVIAKE